MCKNIIAQLAKPEMATTMNTTALKALPKTEIPKAAETLTAGDLAFLIETLKE